MVFSAGELVMLSAKNINQKLPSKKLSPKKLGPFAIDTPIGSQAYRLHLPPAWRIHNVFHVSLLEPYHKRDKTYIPNTTPPELVDDEQQWLVEAVLGRKTQDGVVKYLVKWEGWDEEFNQWVEEQDMAADEKVQAYEAGLPPGKRKRVAGEQQKASKDAAVTAQSKHVAPHVVPRTIPAVHSRNLRKRRT